jgi:hypothetical protein
MDNSSNPNWTRAKGSSPEKNATSKKELLTLTPGNVADGRCWSRWWWWWVRTSRANHKSMCQHFGVLRVKHRKTSLNRQPSAYTCGGGGSRFSPNTSHVIWKQTVNSTRSKQVIRPPQFTARNFIFFRWTAVRNILQHYFGSGEDDK